MRAHAHTRTYKLHLPVCRSIDNCISKSRKYWMSPSWGGKFFAAFWFCLCFPHHRRCLVHLHKAHKGCSLSIKINSVTYWKLQTQRPVDTGGLRWTGIDLNFTAVRLIDEAGRVYWRALESDWSPRQGYPHLSPRDPQWPFLLNTPWRQCKQNKTSMFTPNHR